MDYEVGICEKCGGRLIYIHCLDKVVCEESCEEEVEIIKGMSKTELNKRELDMVLYSIAKMIDIDGKENKEKWKELFLKLSNKNNN